MDANAHRGSQIGVTKIEGTYLQLTQRVRETRKKGWHPDQLTHRQVPRASSSFTKAAVTPQLN